MVRHVCPNNWSHVPVGWRARAGKGHRTTNFTIEYYTYLRADDVGCTAPMRWSNLVHPMYSQHDISLRHDSSGGERNAIYRAFPAEHQCVGLMASRLSCWTQAMPLWRISHSSCPASAAAQRQENHARCDSGLVPVSAGWRSQSEGHRYIRPGGSGAGHAGRQERRHDCAGHSTISISAFTVAWLPLAVRRLQLVQFVLCTFSHFSCFFLVKLGADGSW